MIKEPKWIRPVQPVTGASRYEGKLSKVVGDVKNDYTKSRFKMGNRTFVVMMVDDEHLLREPNLNENDQFLFEVTKNPYTNGLSFSVVHVSQDSEVEGCYFNGIAQVGEPNQNLLCVKRIDKEGKPVYNLAKYDLVHKAMKPGSITSTKPITFEDGQTVCAIYGKDGSVFGINTNGERTPAPATAVVDGKDNK